jgi:osmoprotectant transport system permease protein
MILLEYISNNPEYLQRLVGEHAKLVFSALLLGTLAGVSFGLLASYKKRFADVILPCAQIMMTVPSIALIGMLLPILGIGFRNGLAALTLYSLLPIIRNTYTGIQEISPSVLEAAKGMGLTEQRILFRIKIPLAMPVIFAGIRTAIVMIVGIAAIASYVGAGGLGELIFRGISRSRPDMIIAGAFFVAVMAISLDIILGWFERKLLARQT